MYIDIDLAQQRLRLYDGEMLLAEYPVSTARNGPGEQEGSYCTPRGRQRIRACIGGDQPKAAVFRG
ncbi:MAG: L,D-transpeptidase, partial [Salinisphaeraceae bacterium]|nr:L,D-transpeptidase [Salinisphaeraceae bacterium]